MIWYKAVVQRSAPCSSDTWALHLSTSSSASKRGMALKQTVASNFHKSHQIALCLVTMPPSRWQRQRVDEVGAFVEIRQSSSIICTVYVQLLPWNKPVNIPILDYIRLSNAKYIYICRYGRSEIYTMNKQCKCLLLLPRGFLHVRHLALRCRRRSCVLGTFWDSSRGKWYRR